MSTPHLLSSNEKRMRKYGGAPVLLHRDGFCLRAELALEQVRTGRIHVITCRDHRMTLCGTNTGARPVEMRRVRNRLVTCLRCLTIALLTINRSGKLAGVPA